VRLKKAPGSDLPGAFFVFCQLSAGDRKKNGMLSAAADHLTSAGGENISV
jgi:hypothetical protein